MLQGIPIKTRSKNHMLRIVYLSHFYPPIHNSGIEQVTHGLARSFHTAGHEVRVLCAGNWAEGDKYYQGYTEDEWEQIKVRRLHLNWSKAPYPTRYLYNNPVTAELVRELLSRETKLSIGIVAFSEAQQTEIENALQSLAGDDSDFAARLEGRRVERFGGWRCLVEIDVDDRHRRRTSARLVTGGLHRQPEGDVRCQGHAQGKRNCA